MQRKLAIDLLKMTNTVKICSLASGSNGNAYYIESGDDAILIDVGISYLQLTKRARARNINLQKIKAVFITHEHSDHIRGLRTFCNKQTAEVYMTHGTAGGCRSYYLPHKAWREIQCGDVVEHGNFRIHCFKKPHDVKEPCSYRVEIDGINIGIFTDIGHVEPELEEHLRQCHAVFLESNYDEMMLQTGPYPRDLKNRIAGPFGHLSNDVSAQLIARVQPPYLHTIILSHLSEHNNTPHIAQKAFDILHEQYKILIASRFEAGPILTIDERASSL